jgi:hypothetical protein
VPLEEIGAKIDLTTTTQTLPEPFDFQKAIDENARFLSIKGDRSSGTGSIVSVNEIPLIEPVKREAGYQYATELGNVQDNRMWASDLSILSKQRGSARKKFTEELSKPRSLKLGFPDQASVRAAISVPDMLGTGSGDLSGRMITKIDYNAPFDETSRHKTYPAGLKGVEGDPVYRIADKTNQFRDVPVSLFFPDFMEGRKVGGVLPPEHQNVRSMELSQATQLANQEVEDIIQNYLRQTYQ